MAGLTDVLRIVFETMSPGFAIDEVFGDLPKEKLTDDTIKILSEYSRIWGPIAKELAYTPPVVKVPASERFDLFFQSMSYWNKVFNDFAMQLLAKTQNPYAVGYIMSLFAIPFAWTSSYKGFFRAMLSDVMRARLSYTGEVVKDKVPVTDVRRLSGPKSEKLKYIAQLLGIDKIVPARRLSAGTEYVLDLGDFANSTRSSARNLILSILDLLSGKFGSRLASVFGLSEMDIQDLRKWAEEIPGPRIVSKESDLMKDEPGVIPRVVGPSRRIGGSPSTAIKVAEHRWRISMTPDGRYGVADAEITDVGDGTFEIKWAGKGLKFDTVRVKASSEEDALSKLGYIPDSGFQDWVKDFAPYWSLPDDPHPFFLDAASKRTDDPNEARRLAGDAQEAYNDMAQLMFFNSKFPVLPSIAYIKLIGGPRYLRRPLLIAQPYLMRSTLSSFAKKLAASMGSDGLSSPGTVNGLFGLVASKVYKKLGVIDSLVLKSKTLSASSLHEWRDIVVARTIQEVVADAVDRFSDSVPSWTELNKYLEDTIGNKIIEVVDRLDHEMWSLRLHTDYIDQAIWALKPIWRPVSFVIFRPGIQFATEMAARETSTRLKAVSEALRQFSRSVSNVKRAIEDSSTRREYEHDAYNRLIEAWRQAATVVIDSLPSGFRRRAINVREDVAAKLSKLPPGSPLSWSIIEAGFLDLSNAAVQDIAESKKPFLTMLSFKRWLSRTIDSAIDSFNSHLDAGPSAKFSNWVPVHVDLPMPQRVIMNAIAEEFAKPIMTAMIQSGNISDWYDIRGKLTAVLVDTAAEIWTKLPKDLRDSLKQYSDGDASLAMNSIEKWIDDHIDSIRDTFLRRMNTVIGEQPQRAVSAPSPWKTSRPSTYSWGLTTEILLSELLADFEQWLGEGGIDGFIDRLSKSIGDEVGDTEGEKEFIGQFIAEQLRFMRDSEFKQRIKYALWEHVLSIREELIKRTKVQPWEVDWSAPWEILKNSLDIKQKLYTAVVSDIVDWTKLRVLPMIGSITPDFMDTVDEIMSADNPSELMPDDLPKKIRELVPKDIASVFTKTSIADIAFSLSELEPWVDLWLAGHVPTDLNSSQKKAWHTKMLELAHDWLKKNGVWFYIGKVSKYESPDLYTLRMVGEQLKFDLVKFLSKQSQAVYNEVRSGDIKPRWGNIPIEKPLLPESYGPKLSEKIDDKLLYALIRNRITGKPEDMIWYIEDELLNSGHSKEEARKKSVEIYSWLLALPEKELGKYIQLIIPDMKSRIYIKSPTEISDLIPSKKTYSLWYKPTQMDIDFAMRLLARRIVSSAPETLELRYEGGDIDSLLAGVDDVINSHMDLIDELSENELPRITGISGKAWSQIGFTPQSLKQLFLKFLSGPSARYRIAVWMRSHSNKPAEEIIRELWGDFIHGISIGLKFATEKPTFKADVSDPAVREMLISDFLKKAVVEIWKRKRDQFNLSYEDSEELFHELMRRGRNYLDGIIDSIESDGYVSLEKLSELEAETQKRLEEEADDLCQQLKYFQSPNWDKMISTFLDPDKPISERIFAYERLLTSTNIPTEKLLQFYDNIEKGERLEASMGLTVPLYVTAKYALQFKTTVLENAHDAMMGEWPDWPLTLALLDRYYVESGAAAYENNPKLLELIGNVYGDDVKKAMEALIFFHKNHIGIPNSRFDLDKVLGGFRNLIGKAGNDIYTHALWLWDLVKQRAATFGNIGFAFKAAFTQLGIRKAQNKFLIDYFGNLWTREDAERLWKEKIWRDIEDGNPESIFYDIRNYIWPFHRSIPVLYGFGDEWAERLQLALDAYRKATGKELRITGEGVKYAGD